MDVHAPLSIVNKYKLKFKTKPWNTPALQKSIFIKNKLLKKFITAKNPQVKKVIIRNIMTTESCFLQFSNKVKLTITIIILKPTGTSLKTHGKAKNPF